jgi:hypothetical protein
MRAGLDRRGLGVFAAVVTVTLGLLMAITVVRMMDSSQGLREASEGAGGAVAEQLALSVLAEGLWRFQRASNDPDDPLFSTVRHKLITEKGEIDLSKELAPHLVQKSVQEQALAPIQRDVTIDAFQARLRPKEFPAVLLLSCTVRLKLPNVVLVRTASQAHPFGVEPLFAPQPLDQLPVAVMQAEALAQHLPTLATYVDVVASYHRAWKQYGILVEKARRFPTGPAGKDIVSVPPLFVSTGPCPKLTTAEEDIVKRMRERQPWRERERKLAEEAKRKGEQDWRERRDLELEGSPPITFAVERSSSFSGHYDVSEPMVSACLLETPPANSTVFSLAKRTNLAEWDPNALLQTLTDATVHDVEVIAREVNQLQSRFQRSEVERAKLPDGGLREFLERAHELFSRMSSSIQAGTETANSVTRRNLLRTRAQIVEAANLRAGPHPLVKCEVEVTKWKNFAKKYPGVNGYVRLADEEYEKQFATWFKEQEGLRIRGIMDLVPPPARKVRTVSFARWQGKTVVDAEYGSLLLNQVSVQDQARDRLIIAGGAVKIATESVEAGIYCTSVEMVGSPKIRGALVFQYHPLKDDKGKPVALFGSVLHDARHIGGIHQDYRDGEPNPARINDSSYLIMNNPRSWDRQVYPGRIKRSWSDS